MIARIATLLGFAGAAGLPAQTSSAHGPSDCPLCCGRSAATSRTDLSRRHLYVRNEAATSVLRGYTFGNTGNVLTSRNSPTRGAQR